MYKTDLQRISTKMIRLNALGHAVIFCVTGVNGSGKTRFTKELLANLPFYQSINMGLFTKCLRYFRKDLHFNALENMSASEYDELYSNFIKFVADQYRIVGVNCIIEGVQIDSKNLNSEENILGGVILMTEDATIIDRGDRPNSHFLRSMLMGDIHHREYEENKKFFYIDNNDDFETAFNNCLVGLEHLLDDALAIKS